LGGRDGRKPSYAIVHVFQMKGNLVRMEGVLGKETGPKDYTIVRMKSTSKRGVALFLRQVASANYGGTVTKNCR
jgi:hypothetical protein